jgi:hypothetical protein
MLINSSGICRINPALFLQRAQAAFPAGKTVSRQWDSAPRIAMHGGHRPRLEEGPNSNIQAPEKFQPPNFKKPGWRFLVIEALEVLRHGTNPPEWRIWMLELGIWSFPAIVSSYASNS